ncbi:MAG TPA: DUF1573 domain-containing protein [Thermoanaerobaculia bacterium]|nr:DUF1573 domain-containing protein [Thermoanaerobaculia bacterium]
MPRTVRALLASLSLFLLFPVTSLFAEETAPSSGPKPKAVVDETVADLGEITRGDRPTHDFIIRNEGDATLEIKEVRPACGCTVVNFDKTIPPKGKGVIHAALDTKGIQGGTSKMISVFTNDPDTPHIQLSLLVKSLDFLVANPGFARFIKGQGYPAGEVKQVIYSVDFEDLKVEQVVSPFPYLKATFHEAKPEEQWKNGKGRQFIVDLVFDYDQAPVGPLNTNVEIYSNHPKQKKLLLPVSGFVRPRMAVTPPVLDFGELTFAGGAEANLLVANFTAEMVKVTGAESTFTGATLEVKPLEEGKKYEVHFVLPESMPKGPFTGSLRIKTDSAKDSVLVVEVKGKVL